MEFIEDLGICVAVLLALILPVWVAALITRYRVEATRKQNIGPVIAQYDPPHGFSPAEVGFIYKGLRCTEQEIEATKYDLKRRGVFDDRGIALFSGSEKIQDLNHYEYLLVNIHDQAPAHPSHSEFSRAIARTLADKGYKVSGSGFGKRLAFIIAAEAIIISVLAYLGGDKDIGELFESNMLFFAPFVYLPIAWIVMEIWVKLMGKSWLYDKQTRELWIELAGYRLFLKETDLDNIQVEVKENDPTQLVLKVLPYAMVFGLDTKWHERLKKNPVRQL